MKNEAVHVERNPRTESGSRLTLFGRLRRFPRYIRNPKVPLWKKMVVILICAYLISPVDMIPELFLPAIGWLDDLGLLTILIAWMYNELGKKEEE